VKRYRYAPYGESMNLAFGTFMDGLGYTGHDMDQDTGLTYMQQRYYDPVIGRFLSVDPIAADVGSFNRYWYAGNNPYKNIDPDGRQLCSSCSGFSYGRVMASGAQSSNANDKAPETVVEAKSNSILRAIVPGQVSWDNALTSFGNEEYGTGASWTGIMLLEQLTAVFTFGVSMEANAARSAVSTAPVMAGGAARVTAATAKELNQIAHVFPRVEKGLEGLVRASGGSQLNALRSVQAAANQALA
jgi:RHS repeat-associated protein